MVRIAVIGAGNLGVKVAGDLAYHGHQVRIYDKSKLMLDSVNSRMQQDKEQLLDDGILCHPNFIGQVICLSRLDEAVKNAEFIFEAVNEDLAVKQDIFERISHICNPNAVLASSYLRLDLNSIFERAAHKERTIGVRFLFPVYCIPEVEMTIGIHTSTDTLLKVHKLLEVSGKTPFLRSGNEPLILTEEQRESRRCERKKQIERNQFLGGHTNCLIPDLAHFGNFAPVQDDSTAWTSGNDKDCSICMDRVRNCVLHPCHHLCTCYDCGDMLLHRLDACPICRKDILDVIKVFYA
ncbi:putative 3-hydroxybutyryl-CoA dehydrogenase [Nymphon striatum]|nr:putative 3-hydroxybutyryl-CoA dehydrogenase [Nymphon striatum]